MRFRVLPYGRGFRMLLDHVYRWRATELALPPDILNIISRFSLGSRFISFAESMAIKQLHADVYAMPRFPMRWLPLGKGRNRHIRIEQLMRTGRLPTWPVRISALTAFIRSLDWRFAALKNRYGSRDTMLALAHERPLDCALLLMHEPMPPKLYRLGCSNPVRNGAR